MLPALAGEGSERSRLEYLVDSLGIQDGVKFLGHVEQVPRLFGACDLLVHTSLVEGIPQAVLQALMAGLPVVATPSLGAREAASRGAVIVDPDAIQLADAIRKLLRSPPAPSDEVAFAEWGIQCERAN